MSAGVLGFFAGLGKGYFQGTLARRKDDRAERGLQIHENIDERKGFWDDQQRNWREYMESRPTPDGSSQWDKFWTDPNKLPDGPMSPIGAPPPPGAAPTGEGPALEADPAAPGVSPSPGDPGSQSSGPTQLQGSGATPAAIPVAAQPAPSAVATPGWNKIGRDARAADGGPIAVAPMQRSGQLWQDPNVQEALPMSPIGQEEVDPRGEAAAFARQQAWDSRTRASEFAAQQPGMAPIERSPSQMNLRGAGPMQPPIQVPGQVAGGPVAAPVAQAIQMQPWNRAAEGGPVEVLPQYQEGGSVEVPAIAAEGAGEITPGPAPQQSPNPPPPSKYRDRLNAWQRGAESHAMMAGGLETLQKFREMENASSRRMILGYGLDAIRALDEGNVGDAMRAGNSALEATPFDTGMKFVAQNGQLHMVGEDGQPGEALTPNHLRAFVEDNMKTPETYLEWKKQVETERAGREGEKLRGREAAVSERRITLDETYREQETDAKTLSALAAYENSQAARDRAARMAAAAAAGGWDENNRLAIERDSQDWVLDNFDPLHEDIDDYFKDNPIAWIDFKNDVLELQLYNPWSTQSQSGSVGRDAASIVSQLIRQPGGVSEKDLGLAEGDFMISEHPDAPGEVIVNYKGQLIALPKVMHADARKHSAYLEAPAEGGGDKQQTGAAAPDSDSAPVSALPTGPPAPPPPGAPEMAREDEAAGYRYVKLSNGKWQLANQYGDPVQSLAPPEPAAPNPYAGENPYRTMGRRAG